MRQELLLCQKNMTGNLQVSSREVQLMWQGLLLCHKNMMDTKDSRFNQEVDIGDKWSSRIKSILSDFILEMAGCGHYDVKASKVYQMVTV